MVGWDIRVSLVGCQKKSKKDFNFIIKLKMQENL